MLPSGLILVPTLAFMMTSEGVWVPTNWIAMPRERFGMPNYCRNTQNKGNCMKNAGSLLELLKENGECKFNFLFHTEYTESTDKEKEQRRKLKAQRA